MLYVSQAGAYFQELSGKIVSPSRGGRLGELTAIGGEVAREVLTVKGKLNGKDAVFLLDTGATTEFVDTEFAKDCDGFSPSKISSL